VLKKLYSIFKTSCICLAKISHNFKFFYKKKLFKIL
jgi:hypothetical protein